MQLESYVLHYILDFPELSNRTGKLSLLGAEHGAMMLHQELLRVPAPSVFAQLEHIIVGEEEQHDQILQILVLDHIRSVGFRQFLKRQ